MTTYMIILQDIVNTETTQNTEIWAIVAAIAASISLFIALRANNLSRRSFEISKQAYSDKLSNFDIHLNNSQRTKVGNKDKYLLFNITIRNQSDSKSSYNANLVIEYVRANETVGRVRVKHSIDYKDLLPVDITSFENDIRIEEKKMETDWLIFKQPLNLSDEYQISKYTILLTDISGEFEKVETYIMKEINYDKQTN